jgi:sigma-E factor negative regulatory protein RseA
MQNALRIRKEETAAERLSALVDGEFDDHEAEVVLEAMRRDPALRRDWRDYHLIGDLMRREPMLTPDFHRKLMSRLDGEPTVLAPRRIRKRTWAAAAVAAAAGLLVWNLERTPKPQDAPSPQPQWARIDRVQPYLVAHEEITPGVAIAEPALLTVTEVGVGAER